MFKINNKVYIVENCNIYIIKNNKKILFFSSINKINLRNFLSNRYNFI